MLGFFCALASFIKPHYYLGIAPFSQKNTKTIL